MTFEVDLPRIERAVTEILEAIVQRIPPPKATAAAPLRALIFDSYYDPYRGVVCFFRIVDHEGMSSDPSHADQLSAVLDELYNAFDTNGDGTVDLSEFTSWFGEQAEFGGLKEEAQGHGHVVKEVTVFPDPEVNRALSCSYDGSVKIWDVPENPNSSMSIRANHDFSNEIKHDNI